MTFGKRGGQGGSTSRPAFAAATPAADSDNGSGLFGGFFAGSGSDEFDINLSHLQPYGHDKSVIMLVTFWLLFGTLGGHRFYLGHWLIAFAMLSLGVTGIVLINLYISQMIRFIESNATADPSPTLWYILLVVGVVQGMWWLIDGIYVICRLLSAKVDG